MVKFWKDWHTRREYNDPWATHPEETDYGWLKRTIVAILLFTIIYVVHIANTAVSVVVDDGVKYMLTTQSDFGMTEKINTVLAKYVDVALLKRVQTTMSRPADPLLYMNKPVEGQLITQFGWPKDTTHPNILSEGITIETLPGTGIHAGAPGKVKLIADSGNYGKTIIIEHSTELETVYGYVGEVLVLPDEMISQGQVIARAGKTGKEKALVYFEIRDKGKPIDPLTRFKGK